MVKDATYIRCKSKFIGDVEEGEEPTLLTFSYFGGSSDDGLLDPEFYPYTGKNLQPDYQSPIVAVKIMTGLSVSKLFFLNYCRICLIGRFSFF